MLFKKVSVLMSIYNESLEEIKMAIDSILLQTYQKFEIILISDNINISSEIKVYLKCLEKNPKIKVIYNKKNIGLAQSMNKAFSFSTGEYIARMDADDFSMKERLEQEVNILENKKEIGLVCSDYTYMDESSKDMNKQCSSFNNKDIIIKLPYLNVIHHPTVMMRRKVFEKSGGYRNFPCAQDYDLWLRMLDNGIKFYIINIPLLKYRIRSSSITSTKTFQQSLTVRYIKKLYIQRKKYGYDSFSEENYINYLKKNHLDDPVYLKKCEKGRAIKIKKDNCDSKIKKLFLMGRLFFEFDFYRKKYLADFAESILYKMNKYKYNE